MPGRNLVRGAVATASLVMLAYALVASPVVAGGGITISKIRSIAKQVLKANTGVFTASVEGPGDTPDSTATITSLSLPDGKYAVFAKLIVLRSTPGTVAVDCEIFAGGTRLDRSLIVLGDGSATDTIPLQGTASGGTVELRCFDSSTGGTTDSTYRNVKVTAVRVPS